MQELSLQKLHLEFLIVQIGVTEQGFLASSGILLIFGVSGHQLQSLASVNSECHIITLQSLLTAPAFLLTAPLQKVLLRI